WQIDLACTGSQKGLMMPPGLSFVVASKAAWQKYNNGHQYYLDMKATYDNALKNSTPYTPAVSLIFGLNQSLNLIINETVEGIWHRHQQLADSVRSAINALKLELFAENPSNALTSVKVPDSIDGEKLIRQFKEFCGMTIAGGQDQLKGKIFRISHLGYYDEFDMVTVIAGLEKVLIHNKFKFEQAAGVKAAMQSLWGTHD
ncbi:MAG: alanine--glyoxylate aminotransferase family protein, partial [Calditrichaeota bacterium]|nr:alanine--glyoxylate aminotransferase family protein [Calditrichota bacterium]